LAQSSGAFRKRKARLPLSVPSQTLEGFWRRRQNEDTYRVEARLSRLPLPERRPLKRYQFPTTSHSTCFWTFQEIAGRLLHQGVTSGNHFFKPLTIYKNTRAIYFFVTRRASRADRITAIRYNIQYATNERAFAATGRRADNVEEASL
jgi:hypothetical protein